MWSLYNWHKMVCKLDVCQMYSSSLPKNLTFHKVVMPQRAIRCKSTSIIQNNSLLLSLSLSLPLSLTYTQTHTPTWIHTHTHTHTHIHTHTHTLMSAMKREKPELRGWGLEIKQSHPSSCYNPSPPPLTPSPHPCPQFVFQCITHTHTHTHTHTPHTHTHQHTQNIRNRHLHLPVMDKPSWKKNMFQVLFIMPWHTEHTDRVAMIIIRDLKCKPQVISV